MNQTEFWLPLQISLMADYFSISEMLRDGRRDGLKFLCEKNLAAKFYNACIELGGEASLKIRDERYAEMIFSDEKSMDILDSYYQSWNHVSRTQLYMIAMPNIFEGKAEVNNHLCNWYLYSIEEFLANDLKGQIAIPYGANDDSPSGLDVREFMVYSDKGMTGLYPGTYLFPDSPRLQRINQ